MEPSTLPTLDCVKKTLMSMHRVMVEREKEKNSRNTMSGEEAGKSLRPTRVMSTHSSR